MDEQQLRVIIFYEHLLGHSTREVANNINRAFGPGTTTYVTVHRWFTRFESGETGTEDRPCSGRPVDFDENALRAELQLHPDATTSELAKTLSCSKSTIENHLHLLGYRRVLAR